MSPYCSERCEVLTLYSLFFQFSSFHVTAVTFGCFEMPSGLCAAVTIGTKVLCQQTAEVLFSRQTKDPLNLSQATKSCLFFVLRATKAAEVCTAPRHYCAQMTQQKSRLNSDCHVKRGDVSNSGLQPTCWLEAFYAWGKASSKSLLCEATR